MRFVLYNIPKKSIDQVKIDESFFMKDHGFETFKTDPIILFDAMHSLKFLDGKIISLY